MQGKVVRLSQDDFKEFSRQIPSFKSFIIFALRINETKIGRWNNPVSIITSNTRKKPELNSQYFYRKNVRLFKEYCCPFLIFESASQYILFIETIYNEG